ncbi:MAG: helix-turn-helix domain-containing protein, partial [Solirubrobacterales bacterium]
CLWFNQVSKGRCEMTTATKPRIKRTRKGSKGKTTMKRAITAYDIKMNALGVQYKGEAGYQVSPEYLPRIAFINPRVVVTLGSRDGCVNTGFLGYVEGDVRRVDDLTGIPFNQAEPIRWNGEQFTDDSGKHIEFRTNRQPSTDEGPTSDVRGFTVRKLSEEKYFSSGFADTPERERQNAKMANLLRKTMACLKIDAAAIGFDLDLDSEWGGTDVVISVQGFADLTRADASLNIHDTAPDGDEPIAEASIECAETWTRLMAEDYHPALSWYKHLKALRHSLKYHKAEGQLAKDLRISRVTLRKWLDGSSTPNQSGLSKLARLTT